MPPALPSATRKTPFALALASRTKGVIQPSRATATTKALCGAESPLTRSFITPALGSGCGKASLLTKATEAAAF